MKKIFILITILLVITTGCGKYGEEDVIKDLDKKINKLNSYKIDGDLEIVNNDEVYNYKVKSSYKKKNLYKVSLLNKSNDYEQIILKNNNGVYVLTPSLNKSFKFQSDWPDSTSQIYLLESIINDIKNDKDREFKETKNSYIFTTDVNYPNNKKLVRQKIEFNKKLKLKNIKVYDNENTILMTFKVNDIDYSPIFKNNYFKVDGVLKSVKTEKTEKTAKIDSSIYPMFLPSGTKLASEEKINKENGNRIIMTFEGEKPFILVEETANVSKEMVEVPTLGEPYMLANTIGAMTENSLAWTSGGVEYYIVSDVMNKNELVDIASSINVLPTMK